MEVDPPASAEKMILVSNNYDGPITTVPKSKTVQVQQQATQSVVSSSSISHPLQPPPIVSSVSMPSVSSSSATVSNLNLVNALQSPLASGPPNSIPSSISASPIVSQPTASHHSSPLITQSLSQGPIVPHSPIASSSLLNNGLPPASSSTSVLSATLQQPSLVHSQLQQMPLQPGRPTISSSGGTIHHHTAQVGGPSSAKIPRIASANPSLNQMLSMQPKQSPMMGKPQIGMNSIGGQMGGQMLQNNLQHHAQQGQLNSQLSNPGQPPGQQQMNMMHHQQMNQQMPMQTNPTLLGNLAREDSLMKPGRNNPPPIEPAPVTKAQAKKPKAPREKKSREKKSAKNQQPPPPVNPQIQAPPNVSIVDNQVPQQMNQAPVRSMAQHNTMSSMDYPAGGYNNPNMPPNQTPSQQPQQQPPQWYQPPQQPQQNQIQPGQQQMQQQQPVNNQQIMMNAGPSMGQHQQSQMGQQAQLNQQSLNQQQTMNPQATMMNNQMGRPRIGQQQMNQMLLNQSQRVQMGNVQMMPNPINSNPQLASQLNNPLGKHLDSGVTHSVCHTDGNQPVTGQFRFLTVILFQVCNPTRRVPTLRPATVAISRPIRWWATCRAECSPRTNSTRWATAKWPATCTRRI